MFTRTKVFMHYVKRLVKGIPGLNKFKGYGRVLGMVGLVFKISLSVIHSVTQLNPMIFIRTAGFTLVQVNQGLITDITALQNGASGPMFAYHTWGIYSQLWFIIFITGLIATYLRQFHVGDGVPKYQLWIISFFVVLTPLQMIGAVIVHVVKTGQLKRGDLLTVLRPWRGLRMVFANYSLWVQPAVNLVHSLPGVGSSVSTNSTGNQSLNSTVKHIKTVKN